MPIIFHDADGWRLDHEEDIIKEIEKGKKVTMIMSRSKVRQINPKRVVFFECKGCKSSIGELHRETKEKVIVHCLLCGRDVFKERNDLQKVYKKTPKHLRKDKAESKNSIKEIEVGAKAPSFFY